MKTSTLKICLFLILTPLFNNANATATNNDGKITRIQFFEGHTGILIKQEGTMTDLGECDRSDHYILGDNHIHYDQMYSLLLASHVSSHSVTLRLEGCLQGFPRVRHIISDKNE